MWRNWNPRALLVVGNIKWCSYMENSMVVPQTSKHRISI